MADTGRYADDLAALFEVLGEPPATLISALVLVDELQEATSDDLIAVRNAVHQLGQADGPFPVTFVGAGLPSLPAQLAEAISYAERLYDYRPIGLLGEDAARAALVRPSLDHDGTWAADAITQALGIAGGYPYFLQAVGKLEQPVAVSELASAMGKRRVSDLSVARNELINKAWCTRPNAARWPSLCPACTSSSLARTEAGAARPDAPLGLPPRRASISSALTRLRQ